MGDREWDNHLSIMIVVQDQDLPCFRIIMANVKQYFMNKLSRMLISIIQRRKLLSTVVGDIGILGRQIKIKARHSKSPSEVHANIVLA
jgi:hypothetical protein